MTPISVNYHLSRACNLRCRFCFATFKGSRGALSTPESLHLVDLLVEAGVEKVNFAGGEPTLHPDLAEIALHARGRGMVTGLISNGARLGDLLDSAPEALCWVGMSIDSADEGTQKALGRGKGGHVARSVALLERVKALGLRVKINSVITLLNWEEDMSDLILHLRPDRWKVFQVLPIAGENLGNVEDLLISSDAFRSFVARHEPLRSEGLAPIPEDNDAMTDSYVMIDPLGRFYGNHGGRYVYSDPILDAGVEAALGQVGHRAEKLLARGGVYPW